MTQLNLSGKEVLMCEVPEGAKGFVLIDMLNYQIMCYSVSTILGRGQDYKSLPKGSSWHLLGLASDLKEEQWAELVEWFELAGQLGYMDYSFDDPRFPFTKATASGLSLLKAHGYKAETTLILVKQ